MLKLKLLGRLRVRDILHCIIRVLCEDQAISDEIEPIGRVVYIHTTLLVTYHKIETTGKV